MRFAGYAAIFGCPDHGGDIICKGAFKRSAKAGIPLLWQHDRGQRIGYIESLTEDERGLRVIAAVDEHAGRRVSAGAGLSFGYRVQAMERRNYRLLKDLDLIEISVVTHPMQPLARVLAVENNQTETVNKEKMDEL